jgi:O-antigen/teichoic acid export membrane protein
LPAFAAAIAAVFACFIPEFLDVSGRIWALEIVAIGFQPAMTVFALPVVQSRQDLRKFVWLAGSSVTVLAISKIVFVVICQLSVVGWVIGDVVTAAVSAILAMTLVRPPKARITTQHIRTVANFAIPLIPHKASYWAITSLSRPALATVSTLTQVGLLSLGLNIASTVSLAVAEINRAVQRRYSLETFPAPTSNTFSPVRWQIMLALSLPAAVGAALALAGRWIFAEPYWAAFALTGVLLVGQAAYGLYPIAVNYLVLTAGMPRYTAIATGSGAIIILSAIFVVGREYGASGVAYATALGYIAMAAVAVLLTRFTKLDISWRAWATCWPEITASFVALGCSVAALLCSANSTFAWLFACGCIASLLGAAVLMRKARPRIVRPASDGAADFPR